MAFNPSSTLARLAQTQRSRAQANTDTAGFAPSIAQLLRSNADASHAIISHAKAGGGNLAETLSQMAPALDAHGQGTAGLAQLLSSPEGINKGSIASLLQQYGIGAPGAAEGAGASGASVGGAAKYLAEHGIPGVSSSAANAAAEGGTSGGGGLAGVLGRLTGGDRDSIAKFTGLPAGGDGATDHGHPYLNALQSNADQGHALADLFDAHGASGAASFPPSLAKAASSFAGSLNAGAVPGQGGIHSLLQGLLSSSPGASPTTATGAGAAPESLSTVPSASPSLAGSYGRAMRSFFDPSESAAPPTSPPANGTQTGGFGVLGRLLGGTAPSGTPAAGAAPSTPGTLAANPANQGSVLQQLGGQYGSPSGSSATPTPLGMNGSAGSSPLPAPSGAASSAPAAGAAGDQITPMNFGAASGTSAGAIRSAGGRIRPTTSAPSAGPPAGNTGGGGGGGGSRETDNAI